LERDGPESRNFMKAKAVAGPASSGTVQANSVSANLLSEIALKNSPGLRQATDLVALFHLEFTDRGAVAFAKPKMPL